MVEALRAVLPADRLVTDPDVLASYSHDEAEWADYELPAAAIRPRTAEEVQAVVRACIEHRTPILLRPQEDNHGSARCLAAATPPGRPAQLGTTAPTDRRPIARAVDAARSTRDLPADAIIGHPASAGRATGRVRIIAGQGDFASLGDGEVLVAKVTTPAWTPLFTRAAAVVTDGGTLAAHASLVAREYGIPAVVGTGDATTRGCAPDSLSPSTAAPAPYDAPILADARPILTL